MDILIWIMIVLLFILSFVGILFPVIPSSLLLWGGFLLYHFIINNTKLSLLFWVMVAIFTIILFVSDMIVNSYFVKKFGGSKWGERGAAIAVIIGSFIIPPFGIVIIPFVTVITIELFQKRGIKEAFRASIGSFIGFLSSIIAKIFIHLAMIAWFIYYIL